MYTSVELQQKAKGHARKYFKTIGESINLALHAWVVIECVAVKVAELRDVPLQDGALEGCNNIGIDEGNVLESDKALKTLYKKHDVPIIYVSSYQHYLTFFVCPMEVEVKVAQVGLIPSFCGSFW